MSEKFIKMISDVQFERFNANLSELVKNQTPCGIFFGFEFNPNAAAANIRAFRNISLNLTCAIVLVDDQATVLKNLTEISVLKLEEMPNLGNETKPQTIFIFDSLTNLAFTSYFENQGIKVLDRSAEGAFFFTMRHLPELYTAYNIFSGEESKKVFCAAIKGRLTGKISDYRFAPEPQYFLHGFTPGEGDIAIDGGAFDCATSIDFAKFGAKVYAFEMNADNYNNCQNRLNVSGGGL